MKTIGVLLMRVGKYDCPWILLSLHVQKCLYFQYKYSVSIEKKYVHINTMSNSDLESESRRNELPDGACI